MLERREDLVSHYDIVNFFKVCSNIFLFQQVSTNFCNYFLFLQKLADLIPPLFQVC